jgi:hypothetical protein
MKQIEMNDDFDRLESKTPPLRGAPLSGGKRIDDFLP